MDREGHADRGKGWRALHETGIILLALVIVVAMPAFAQVDPGCMLNCSSGRKFTRVLSSCVLWSVSSTEDRCNCQFTELKSNGLLQHGKQSRCCCPAPTKGAATTAATNPTGKRATMEEEIKAGMAECKQKRLSGELKHMRNLQSVQIPSY